MDGVYKRLARVEALANGQKAESRDVLQNAYNAAVEAQDKESAAMYARKIRDKLLNETDKEMALDRLGVDFSSITSFLSSLGTIFEGAWAKYRQDLRDLPQQPGFPFNITFPEPPGDDSEER